MKHFARRWYGGVLGVLLLSGAAVLFGGAPALATDHGEAETVAVTDLAAGGELYRANCAACHSSTGIGGALTYTRNAPPLGSFSPLTLAAAVRGGPGDMPNFGPQILTDTELAQLVTYTEYLKAPYDRGGIPIGHVGPMMEGLVVWWAGVVALVLGAMWLGDRRA